MLRTEFSSSVQSVYELKTIKLSLYSINNFIYTHLLFQAHHKKPHVTPVFIINITASSLNNNLEITETYRNLLLVYRTSKRLVLG